MQLPEVMHELEAAGSAQFRKIYAKHGVVDEMFGVSTPTLKALTRKIKQDHPLAQELWATGNYDARALATMIADPQNVTWEQAEQWVRDVKDYGTASYVAEMLSKTPFAREIAEQWSKSDEEYRGRVGWHVLARLVAKDTALPDTYFESYLATIEREIHEQKNRKREAMNGAVIAIGSRGGELQEKALLTAKNVGKVYIDHGDTGCKTPDASEYILKTVARKQPVKQVVGK